MILKSTIFIGYYSFFFIVFIGATIYAQSSASYTISLSTTWNATDHSSIPPNAHWSALVGATHKNTHTFFNIGQLATLGIKNVAELGSNTAFNNEVNSAIANNKANAYINVEGKTGALATFTIENLQVSEEYPSLTLVSMIAPSPDWFIGINSENLRSENNNINNGWKETYTKDVFAYDAGTDDGTDYTSNNLASDPPIEITKIKDYPINDYKMGTITFTYNGSTLSTKSNDAPSFKIFPNPTQGIVNILNTNNEQVSSLELFDVIGNQVEKITFKTKKQPYQTIDLSALSTGIYLVRLISGSGKQQTQKLVVN
ncbi:T9SS type A sorting domain-containing protein [Gaetbulibacter saemankumensis]|uniref:T9SS type A sorting domain-containing protein n=1 Tax=Gaetbulibacter saemankumensis TaxID=311208 RepID=UPI000685BB3C|nr:spondin domain-containing protein [Gaetbulibacter saemankumensis]